MRVKNIYKISNLFQKQRFELNLEDYKECTIFDHQQCFEYLFYFPNSESFKELNSIIYDDFCTDKELAPHPILFNTLSGGDLHRVHSEFLSFKEKAASEFI